MHERYKKHKYSLAPIHESFKTFNHHTIIHITSDDSVASTILLYHIINILSNSLRHLPRLEAASRQCFSWLGLASASHGLASVSTLLPRTQLCLIVSASVLARSGR